MQVTKQLRADVQVEGQQNCLSVTDRRRNADGSREKQKKARNIITNANEKIGNGRDRAKRAERRQRNNRERERERERERQRERERERVRRQGKRERTEKQKSKESLRGNLSVTANADKIRRNILRNDQVARSMSLVPKFGSKIDSEIWSFVVRLLVFGKKKRCLRKFLWCGMFENVVSEGSANDVMKLTKPWKSHHTKWEHSITRRQEKIVSRWWSDDVDIYL